MEPSDDELVYRIRIHDEEAFELLFKRYKSMVYRYSHYLTLNSTEAEDLFQDTWFRVVKYLPSYGKIESIHAWICKITSNLYRDLLRKKKYQRILFKDKPYTSVTSDENVENVVLEVKDHGRKTEVRIEMQRAIALLPYRQRQVFILKEIEGFKLSEIGQSLQMPLGTVKSLHYRAVRHMRNELCDLQFKG
ncbi:MAG: RNA polymerase sigma factor [Acidobacteriota bacterium]|jgi:RNA polymerase sigma-70 factor (ECF subfamily)